MAGIKGKSGNQGWKKDFDAACMLAQSAGRLIYVQNVSEEEAQRKQIFTSAIEKGKTEVAKTVFLKLAPSNINLGGQANNPLSVVQLVTMNDENSLNKTSVKGN